jgi:hypothetical protein
MAINRIPLRKLLQLMYAPSNLRTSKLREDIRNEIASDDGIDLGGPDFFSPFWRSAKDHVFGSADLHNDVDEHIAANYRRARLFRMLRDGFLLWWNERRRWTNEPFVPADTLVGSYLYENLNLTVKVGNIMAVKDGNDEDHFIYPYFSEIPTLTPEAARVGLWMMRQIFPNTPEENLRILDVIRGQNFSLEDVPLQGDELQILTTRFRFLLAEWASLREEYPPD